MKLFLIILFFAFFSCENKKKSSLNSNNINLELKDSVYYDYRDKHLSFTIMCVDSIPFFHLIILNGGQGINEKIDFSDNEKSFFDCRNGKIKMFSYFSFDTLQCKYKIYNDTLEFIFMSNYELINQDKLFFLIHRKNEEVYSNNTVLKFGYYDIYNDSNNNMTLWLSTKGDSVYLYYCNVIDDGNFLNCPSDSTDFAGKFLLSKIQNNHIQVKIKNYRFDKDELVNLRFSNDYIYWNTKSNVVGYLPRSAKFKLRKNEK